MNAIGLWNMTIISVIVIAYIVITTGLSIWLRSKTTDQFMVAARALPAAVAGVVMMSEFIGTPATVGAAQQAFTSGMAASWSIVNCVIAFPLMGIVMAGRLYRTGQYTISGAIASKFGEAPRLITSAIVIYALFLVNISAYVGGAAAISTVYKIPLPLAALATAIISTIYFSLGGLKGIAWVSIIHASFKYLCVIISVVTALKLTGGFGVIYQHLPTYYFTWDGTLGGSTVLAWTIGNIGAIFVTQQIVQTMCGVGNANDARKACMYAGIWCVPIGLMAAFIGVAAKYLYPNMKSLFALPVFIQHMNPFLGGIVTAGIVAAVFGGVATVSLGMTSLVVRDFVVPLVKPRPEQQLRITRYVAILVGFLPLPFVLFMPGILKTMFFSKALRTAVALVAVSGFYLPMFSSGLGATIGLIAAALGASVWFFLGNPYGIDNTYVAMVIPIVVMSIDHIVRIRMVGRKKAGPPGGR
ncbi:MAG TPA: sodium:solute symporter family protein [Syntrophorhabdales bacterium]|nr:sodium:solute symporter family protein [Syntrophorhabdales bacterium]